MTPARPYKRFCAFIVDTAVYLSFFFGVGRLLWELVPGTEVPVKAMQLFNTAQAIVYLSTVLIGVLFAVAYFNILPATRWKRTVGQQLFNIWRVRLNGEPLRLRDVFRLVSVTVLKAVLIFLSGPLAAFVGGPEILSWLCLLFPLGFVLVATVVAWSRPDGCWIWERIGRYRYIERDFDQV